MKTLTKLAFALSAVLSFNVLATEKEDPTKQYDFLKGQWNCEYKAYAEEKVTYSSACTWEGRYTLEGSMFQDDFRLFNAEGNKIFSATTIRTWVPQKNRWDLAALFSQQGHYPNFHGVWENDEMVISVQGEDPKGKFDGKIRFFDIDENTFSWKLERSYDQGKTWHLGVTIDAKRKSA